MLSINIKFRKFSLYILYKDNKIKGDSSQLDLY